MKRSLVGWALCYGSSLFPSGAAGQPAPLPGGPQSSQRQEKLSTADARAIRGVIEAQLDAFARDDADRAFSYAAPMIQAMFGNAQAFLRMVRTGYPAVYRPASVTFLKPEVVEGETLQRVQLSDSEGQVWVAWYRMQRQKNKLWRINGCELEKSDGRVT